MASLDCCRYLMSNSGSKLTNQQRQMPQPTLSPVGNASRPLAALADERAWRLTVVCISGSSMRFNEVAWSSLLLPDVSSMLKVCCYQVKRGEPATNRTGRVFAGSSVGAVPTREENRPTRVHATSR